MPHQLVCPILFSLPELVVKCVNRSSVGGRRCWLWAKRLPVCSKCLLPLYVVGLLAPAAKLCAKSWQLFPHSGVCLSALRAARPWCMLFQTDSRAVSLYWWHVLKDSGCMRVDSTTLEHTILKELCICTTLVLLMTLPLLHILFFSAWNCAT